MPASALQDLAHQQVQAQLLGVRSRLLAAREIDQVVHQQRELLDLLDDVAEQPAAVLRVHVLPLLLQDLDVRAQAGHGGAQLVRRVGHELALRVHGRVERAHRSLQRIEHLVEAARQPSELVVARWLDAPAEIAGQRDVLGGVGETLQRLHRGARDQAPEHGGERDAADHQQREDQPQAGKQAVDFGERLGELHGVPVAQRLGQHAQVDAVDARVAQERLAAVRRQRARARVHRQRHCFRRADEDRAVGVDHLLVAAHLVGTRGQAAEDVAAARARPRGRLGVGRAHRSPGSIGRGVEYPFGGQLQPLAAAERGAAEAFGVERPHELAARTRAVAQLRVEEAVQLIGGEHVGEDRREHHRDRHRGGRRRS